MVKVKDLTTSKANYAGSASEAVRRWKQEIPKAEWRNAALSPSAVELHRVKTIEALDAGRREKGIEAVSDAEWRTRTLQKGGSSMGTAMTQSADKWAQKYSPYRSALEALDLPDKTADAMQNIDNRLKPVVAAQQEVKRQIKG